MSDKKTTELSYPFSCRAMKGQPIRVSGKDLQDIAGDIFKS
jgi:hypothetical protein